MEWTARNLYKNKKGQTMATNFNPNGKFHVRYLPSGTKWDDEEVEEGKLPTDWFTSRADAEAYATKKAQMDNDMDTYVVLVPVFSVVKEPPNTVTAKLD